MDFSNNIERGFKTGYKLFDSLEADSAFASGEGTVVEMLLVSVGGAVALKLVSNITAALAFLIM